MEAILPLAADQHLLSVKSEAMIELFWFFMGSTPSRIKITKCLACYTFHIAVHPIEVTVQQCFDKIIIITTGACKPSAYHMIKHIPDFTIRDRQFVERWCIAGALIDKLVMPYLQITTCQQ